MAASLAAPAVAHAHGGGNYTAGPTTIAPTVDGVLTASEWADATPYSVVFGDLGNATVRFVHHGDDLYVGVVVQDPAPSMTPTISVYFDDDHDGVKDAGEDMWGAPRFGGQDFYFDPDAGGHVDDFDGGGPQNTVGAASVAAGNVEFELKHPLCSADTDHDICASVALGETLGLTFQYERGAVPGDFVNAPGPDTMDPNNNWAHLTLSATDSVAPTVSVTAPAAGSLLRGTVAVAAVASDNVGVTAVDFKYDGDGPLIPIATDTEPPYEATFDSTTVPNTVRGGGTVYAFARDAAGNETGVGNSVMVDNPPSRIVFETDRDGNSEIYIMEPNGNDGITRLTNDPAVDTTPSLSPDGSLIAWQSGDQIWLMSSDGSGKQALTSGNRDGAPAFSPDGTRIAFQRDPPADMSLDSDIWVMNVDGTGQTNLTNAAGNDVGATWSPDATKLAFDSDRSGNRDIFTMNADGTSQTSLAWNSPQIDADPDWSPDGQKILFVSGRGGGGTVVSVWSANADGSGGALNVTNASIFDADPAWSPTGDRIVFTRDSGGMTFNLHLAAADGSTAFPPRITFAGTTQRNSFPDWGAAPALTFTVTTTDDHHDGSCDEGDCTLREAIDAANAHVNGADPDEIHFAIPAPGLQTIALDAEGGALAPITDPVVIDGTTQPGFVANPLIFVNGIAATCGLECSVDGITVADGVGTTIRGLAIGNFNGRGIMLAAGSSQSVIEGSWIGFDQFGPGSSRGNDLGGIRIEGDGNRIGGPLPAQRVFLGSNGNFGGGEIEITGAASGNLVQGSYIGLNPDGEYTYDTEDGVLITNGASGNTIGGDSSAGEGNRVYGFYGRGIVLDGSGTGNVVAGNTIGLSASGDIGEAPDVGIDVVASPATDVGDSVSPPGFANPARGNVVVGAAVAGIRVSGASSATRVAGNFVGLDRVIASVDFGNDTGIHIPLGSDITIGPGNTVAYNDANGVEIDNEGSSGNRIVANSIHDNGGLGIALLSFSNNALAAPTMTSATTADAATTVDGTVTAPAGTYFVEFFTNDGCDPSGAGEGKTYVGFATVVVSGVGTVTVPFTQNLPAFPVGTVLTATTTSSATSDTSAFSDCVTVAAGVPAGGVVTLEPAADTYVDGAATGTNFGAADHFDTYGGFSASCVPHSAPAYGLLRFDLSTLPPGQIADAKIVLTSRAGYAQDGDGNHHAIFLTDDSWDEATVTWTSRPFDGTVGVGEPFDDAGNDIRLSSRALGADFVWRNTCGIDLAGDQTKVFPSNTDTVKTLAAAQADMIATVTSQRDGDDQLSVEIYNPNCASCPGGLNKAYWARYYSREAANPDVRPKLVVTYLTTVETTSFTATPANPTAGLAQIAIGDVPPSVLLAPPSTTASAPLGDTPLGDTPLGDTPLGDTPLGDTPLGDTSLGLGNLLAELGTVPLSSLPLLRDGGWPAVLAGTPLAFRALQNVSLGDVLALSPRPAVLDGQGADDITLAELDFSRSSLGDVAMIAYALGYGVTLAELSGAFTNGVLDPDLQRWCTLTNTNCSPTSTTSILALGLRGAPLGDTPLGDTPLGDTPLADTPLGDTPLGDTPLADTPLGDTPLSDTPLGDTPLGDTPLDDTDFRRAPLGDTPLGDTPLGDTPLGDTPLGDTPLGDTPLGDTQFSALTDCAALFTDCPNDPADRLKDHRAFLRAGVTIGDLIAALTPTALSSLTLSDVLDSIPDSYAYTLAHAVVVITNTSVTLADLVASLPNANDFTLNDLLLAVLRAGAQWERIDLTQPALARVSTGGGSVSLTADVTVSASSVLTFTVDLPRGWTAAGSPPWIESVPPGFATVLDLVGVEPAPGGGTRHTLRTQFAVGGDQRFHFDVRPGTTLGPASASLAVAAAGGTPNAPSTASIDVRETFEPNNDPATAPILAPGTLYVSYLTSAADTDFYRVTVPATGTRTTIHLSHLPEDYDLVVYGRQGVAPLVTPGDAPPLETPVLGDGGAPITHLTDALPSETLDDLTLLTDRPLLGVSAFRTTEDEAVVAISDGVPGEYVLQVTGYNGASSVEPYMVRVKTEAPRLAPACQPRFTGVSFGSAAGVNVAAIPADADTVFLANGPQLAAAGGQAVLDWFSMAHLDALRGTGHPSALVRLEDDPDVRAAYAAWNLEPCSSARANDVVRAITDVVRDIRVARPSLRHLVLLGSDTALPFARLDDLTTIANEADYAATFARGDDLYGALFEHRVLSDDPYATTDPIPYLQRQLFVPQLAVGRLVETSTQITGALDRFLAFDGELDPASARTSGYDFLQDGASGVAAAFADVVGAQQPITNPPLIGNLWTRDTLAGALGTGTGLIGMNGHADHSRLQPARDADNDGKFEDTDLFSAANLPASLERAVVFSMGCHSGLSASDASVAGAAAADWAQAFAARGTAAYAANLGYGYGDTVTVAYSEALNVRLAEGLRDGLPIGEALVEAKQGYLADLGLVGVYDEKALAELALYGLPMWSLGGAAQAAAPSASAAASSGETPKADAAAAPLAAASLPSGVTRLSTETDPITGLVVDRYESEPVLTPRTDTGDPGETYWEGPSGVQVTHLRPLQPKVQFEVAEDAHGVLITGLASDDESPIDPVYARPIVDSSAAEPELPFADVAFPAKIQTLVSQRTRTGRRVSAVLVHGQFFSDDVADADGAGVQRLFTRVELDVLRSAGAERLAPRFEAIEAVVLPGSGLVSFSADTVDLPGGTAAGVVRVLVAFRDETSPTWRFLDLERGAGSTWGGTAAVSGTEVEYFVQAVDISGNVAVSTNKGLLFEGAPPTTPSGEGVEPSIAPSLGGTQTAGWFTPAAVLDVEAEDGILVSVSIDGGALTPFSAPVTIAEDGLHIVQVRGSNGYEATLVAPVDAAAPTVALDQPGATVPLNGRVPLSFRCADTASGVASCSATVDGTPRSEGFEVPASPLGSTHTIVLSATDRVGRSTTQTFTFTVRARGILYTSSATGSGDLYLLPVDAGPSTTPTRLTATSFPEADPVWSPDSRRIAFASNRDGTWRIFLMDADGTDVELLPSGTGDATEPAWSPDGGRIAFVSTRSGNSDIWVVNLDGSGLRRLTTDSKLDVAPTWSPQSTNRIAWSNGPGGQLDIWTMRPDGSSKTRLTSTQDVNTEAAWGSDGTIAFARRAKGTARFEIWTMTSGGRSLARIIVSNARNDTQPTWLQDGRLVFASDRDNDRDYDLFRATKAKTSWPHVRVTDAPGHDVSPNG